MKKLIPVLLILVFAFSINIYAGNLNVNRTVTSSTPASYYDADEAWGQYNVCYHLEVCGVATNYSACATICDQNQYSFRQTICIGSGEYGCKNLYGCVYTQNGPVVFYDISVGSGASVLEIYALAEASW